MWPVRLLGMTLLWITNGFPKHLTTFAVTRTSSKRLRLLFTGKMSRATLESMRLR